VQVGEVSTLALAFSTARTAQRNAFSQTDTLRTGRRETRKALTMQLTRNTLTLASDFLDNEDGFDDYFDLTLLPKRNDTNPVAPGTVIISGLVMGLTTGNAIVDGLVPLSTAEGPIEVSTGPDCRYELQIEEVEETVSTNLSVLVGGYGPQTRPISITPDEDQTQDFELVPLEVPEQSSETETK